MSTLKFVNRISEIETLRNLSESNTPSPLYLYGPEGCGKTRLLLEFVNLFPSIVIYIDALESDVSKALLIKPFLKEFNEFISNVVGQVTGPIGKYLIEKIFSIISNIAEKISLKGRIIVIAVDDVTRAIGINKVDLYLKWLYELNRKLREEYEPKNVLIIATTSEGESLDRVLRHNYTWTRLLWNLNKEATIELVKELNPPEDDIISNIWRLTGGNPRAIIDIACMFSWNIDTWLREIEKKLVRVFLLVESKDLVRELKLVVEDSDNIFHRPSSRMLKLYKILVKENLIIYKYISTLDCRDVPRDLELGVGTYFAWQLPAYRMIMEKLAGS